MRLAYPQEPQYSMWTDVNIFFSFPARESLGLSTVVVVVVTQLFLLGDTERSLPGPTSRGQMISPTSTRSLINLFQSIGKLEKRIKNLNNFFKKMVAVVPHLEESIICTLTPSLVSPVICQSVR